MEDYIVQNLLWLRSHFPNVYVQLRNRHLDETKVRLINARNGQANIELKLQDKWVSLYSRYNPEQEAYRWAHQLQLDTEEVIIIGCGLGYHIKALLDLNPHIRVHIFELDENIMLAALQGSILYDLPPARIASISIGCFDNDKENFEQSVERFFLPILDKLYNKKIHILILPAYQRWFEQEIQIIMDAMKKMVVSQRFDLHTTLAFEEHWTLNALYNLPYTLTTPSVSQLKQNTKGRPLIIVSSGPSMEKEVELLKKNRNKAIILAAGSSVNGLVHHGVLPHAVVSFDPAPPNKKVFDLLFSHGVQVPLIFGTTIYHKILSDYHYKSLFHVIISQDKITPLVYQHLGEDPSPILSDAPTVAILALQLAVYWACNPIIFVGQDLATPNNKFYAEGVSHLRTPDLSEEERKQYFEVEKVGGGTVLTSPGLNRMRENMEKLLSWYSKNNSNLFFINTSTEGARIQGTVEMTLNEALQTYGTDEIEYDEWFQTEKNLPYTDRINKAKHYLKNELFLKQTDTDRIMDKLAETNRKLQKTYEREQLVKIFSGLDRLSDELQKHPLFQIIYYPMLRTQFDLYNRMAAQVYQQFASVEKAKLIQQRLEAILAAYDRAKKLIQECIDSFIIER